MKKIFILILMLLFIFSSFSFSEKKAGEKKKKATWNTNTVTKTYILKHISPREVKRALGQYILNSAFLDNRKIITITMITTYLPKVEKFLKQIDRERRTITFRIFSVIASHATNGEKIENRDLKNVLAELNELLNFKSFKLDGISLLSIKEGATFGRVLLSSKIKGLRLDLSNVVINDNIQDKRSIEIRELKLSSSKNTLLITQTSIKENGYLVAGVSKLDGEGSDSIVLIINAKIE